MGKSLIKHLFLATALLLLFAIFAISQSQQKLYFTAADKDGNFVEGLTPADIKLKIDGKNVEFKSLEMTEKPLVYVMAIDSSGSLRSVFYDILNLSCEIVSGQRDDDKTLLMSFVSSEKIVVARKFSSDKDYLCNGINSMYVSGGATALIDPIYEAVLHVTKEGSGLDTFRQAVLVISDGEDRSSNHKEGQLIDLLRKQNVSVFFLSLTENLGKGGLIGKSPKQKALDFANRITDASGGATIVLNKKTNPYQIPQQIFGLMRKQYVIAYEGQPGANIELKPTDSAEKKKMRFSFRSQ